MPKKGKKGQKVSKKDKKQSEDDSQESNEEEIAIEIPKFPLTKEQLKDAVKAVNLIWKYGDDEGETFDPDLLEKHLQTKLVSFLAYWIDLATFCIQHPRKDPPYSYRVNINTSYLFYTLLKNDWIFAQEIEQIFPDFYPKILEAVISPNIPDEYRQIFLSIWHTKYFQMALP
ncbi:MAG: hypothetical protein EZS28_000402 [Streblomastix strix]|uniref:Uncharacterized protein n=1 Tax=Streblomastix strix TaxID=222440 RepID=A0A5J4X9T3_9EUKA|nr:MAG: hypothetical protein EZS28_000402 [Streblomastix strix]